jgi:hypothetical protein
MAMSVNASVLVVIEDGPANFSDRTSPAIGARVKRSIFQTRHVVGLVLG